MVDDVGSNPECSLFARYLGSENFPEQECLLALVIAGPSSLVAPRWNLHYPLQPFGKQNLRIAVSSGYARFGRLDYLISIQNLQHLRLVELDKQRDSTGSSSFFRFIRTIYAP